mmetsp:Transcript_43593/g.93346  ORF Transcript_43593/g.93346 Transcript_43593/m.93346 type:complete len:535 (-) Transcript_43593:15-1619(-)
MASPAQAAAAAKIKKKPPIPFRALEKVRVRPQSLVKICLKRVAESFLSYDNLEAKLGKKQLEDVYAMLDLNISLPEAATRIRDENYWKRRTQSTHRNAQVEKHGMSWKQTFLELELQEALERLPVTFDYDSPDLEALRQQVNASRLHIFRLQIGQFPSHVDLSFLFDALPALCCFSITYGSRRLGMDYERAMFGMKVSDAQYLARNIRVSQTLVSLALPCNTIDDELVKVLMGGLAYAHMLTSLDLSHNKIGDRGARRLASLLDSEYCIESLDLSDNMIHANGCMHLGAHLAENVTCSTLNLRLNRCEDNGVSHLFQDLCVNKCLTSLNISSNDLTVRCLPYMNSMLAENSTLMELDLSANPLYQPEQPEGGNNDATSLLNATQLADGSDPLMVGAGDSMLFGDTSDEALAGLGANSHYIVFARCLMKSQALLRLDIRQCGFPPELAERITTTVKHRELRAKDIPVQAYENSKIVVEEQIDEENEEEEGSAAVDEGGEGDGAQGDAKSGEEKEDGSTAGEEKAAGETATAPAEN